MTTATTQRADKVLAHLTDGWFQEIYMVDADGEFGFKWRHDEDGTLVVSRHAAGKNVKVRAFAAVLKAHGNGRTNIVSVRKSVYDCDWAVIEVADRWA